MPSPPAVSIIIAAYNCAAFIHETLQSVFAQRFRDFEIIVVNDGSTDQTEAVLLRYQEQIRYYRQENRGPAGARNTGLRFARGRYVALLDNDDLWAPDYLEKMVDRLEARPETGLIYPNAVLFGSPRWEGRLFQDIYPSSAPVTLEKLITRECNVFASCLFRRELVTRFGLFDETLPRGVDDYDFWLRLARRGVRMEFTPEPLVRYRKRENALSMNGLEMTRGAIRIYEKLLAEAETTPEQREMIGKQVERLSAEADRMLGKRLIAEGKFANAVHYLQRANLYERSLKIRLLTLSLNIAPRLVARFLPSQEARTR
ncbi:MAG: glycosyltransferase family 2 protein [Blastocatellia bacterium]